MIRIGITKALPCPVCAAWKPIGEPCQNCMWIRMSAAARLEWLRDAENKSDYERNLEAAPF